MSGSALSHGFIMQPLRNGLHIIVANEVDKKNEGVGERCVGVLAVTLPKEFRLPLQHLIDKNLLRNKRDCQYTIHSHTAHKQ